MHLVFWQPIPSFHQAGLFQALSRADWVSSLSLRYEAPLPADRARSGWSELSIDGLDQKVIDDQAPPVNEPNTAHVFTGWGTHPGVWRAFSQLPSKRRLCHSWAYAECPELYELKGTLRKVRFRLAARRITPRLDGVFAIGKIGVDFYGSLVRSGLAVIPFGYYDVQAADIRQTECMPAATSDKAYRFLYVGQCIRRKGLDRLLKALSNLQDLEWMLDVVGGGAELDRLQKLAMHLKISERITWYAPQPHAALPAFYQNADCVVLPSRWDGWGMTINEGLRHGCDVVATTTCGAADLVPAERRLRERCDTWPDVLRQCVEAGGPSAEKRLSNQADALKVSGEAGAAKIAAALMGADSKAAQFPHQ